MGLSPHIRGNVRLYRSTGRSAGSIPAHTGERGAIIRLASSAGVYPRTYGGTLLRAGGIDPSLGLSPHIRGNGRSKEHDTPGSGSIPAHTGER